MEPDGDSHLTSVGANNMETAQVKSKDDIECSYHGDEVVISGKTVL